MKTASATLAVAAILLSACAEGETVVRNDDATERLAEYERAAETAIPAEQPMEVLASGTDYTRLGDGDDSVHDRFAVPTNSPFTDVPKTEQVGATVCPDDMLLADRSTLTLDEDYSAWLLDLSENGQTRYTADDDKAYAYYVVRGGIERGYQPQAENEIVLSVDGGEVKLKPADAGRLGAVIMAMSPCEIVDIDSASLDETMREALDLDEDDARDVTRLQLVDVQVY